MTGIERSDRSLIKCILLLDDDLDDRELFYDAVKAIHADTKVILLKNWEELFEKSYLRQGEPEVIFLDLNMPRKIGNECLKLIALDDQLKNIPVVIYSTTVNPADVDDTFEHGAVLFVRKFNSYEQMLSFMSKLIQREIKLVRPVDLKAFVF
jgi:DNA-binding NarL/FixJ family response regulator